MLFFGLICQFSYKKKFLQWFTVKKGKNQVKQVAEKTSIESQQIVGVCIYVSYISLKYHQVIFFFKVFINMYLKHLFPTCFTNILIKKLQKYNILLSSTALNQIFFQSLKICMITEDQMLFFFRNWSIFMQILWLSIK